MPGSTSHRLFRDDAFLRTFDARVARSFSHDDRPAVILDRTAFYPSAGGQPNDLGALNGVRVLNVIERDDGDIVHVLAAPLADDAVVTGEIDWPRRLDHMQHHSGQHVLSQAFVRATNFETVSVHMPTHDGDANPCTIDLQTPRLTAEQAQLTEDEANRIVFDDLQIVSYEVTDADLHTVPLRRPPKVTGLIRIVEVDGYDWSACGGTHVRRAGQIGLVRVGKIEKRGNETRVYFRCGARALADYRRASGVAAQLSETLSATVPELPQAVARLRDDALAKSKALNDAHEKLLGYEARELRDAAEMANGVRVVRRAWAGRDGGQLRALAKGIVSAPDTFALLAGVTDKTALVFARSPNLSHDMRPLLQAALQQLQPAGARGGGTPDLAQGGANMADLARVEALLAGLDPQSFKA